MNFSPEQRIIVFQDGEFRRLKINGINEAKKEYYLDNQTRITEQELESQKFSSTTYQKFYGFAYDAYRHISFSPSDRAIYQLGLFHRQREEMKKDLLALKSEQEYIDSVLEKMENKYIDYLSAKSRTASPMITGPSKFPTARNEKYMRSEDNKYSAYTEFLEKVMKYARKRHKAKKTEGMTEIEVYEQKLQKLERAQEVMKECNAIHRSKIHVDDKIKKMIDLGIKEQNAIDLVASPRKPFESFSLTNNNAKIKAARQKVEYLRSEANKDSLEVIYESESIKAVNNREVKRVQLHFDGIPELEIRQYLKKNGFRWSRKFEAWQRHNTPNGLSAARRFLAINYNYAS